MHTWRLFLALPCTRDALLNLSVATRAVEVALLVCDAEAVLFGTWSNFSSSSHTMFTPRLAGVVCVSSGLATSSGVSVCGSFSPLVTLLVQVCGSWLSVKGTGVGVDSGVPGKGTASVTVSSVGATTDEVVFLRIPTART